jgi:hypothetical protein
VPLVRTSRYWTLERFDTVAGAAPLYATSTRLALPAFWASRIAPVVGKTTALPPPLPPVTVSLALTLKNV